MDNFNELFYKLSKSKFRSSFHLKETDYNYLKEKGYKIIETHAREFIEKRLSPKVIINDGKQTPMKGHPVFIAQHATATCCRGCLFKWHHIPQDKKLDENEINYIVSVIMKWLSIEANNFKKRC